MVVGLSFPCFAQEASSSTVFLADGVGVNIAEASGDWQKVGNFLETEGAGSKLVAGLQIGPGDFSIRAEMALEKMDRSAAVFKMGAAFLGSKGGTAKYS